MMGEITSPKHGSHSDELMSSGPQGMTEFLYHSLPHLTHLTRNLFMLPTIPVVACLAVRSFGQSLFTREFCFHIRFKLKNQGLFWQKHRLPPNIGRTPMCILKPHPIILRFKLFYRCSFGSTIAFGVTHVLSQVFGQQCR